MKRTRTISLLVALVLCLSILPMSAFAASGYSLYYFDSPGDSTVQQGESTTIKLNFYLSTTPYEYQKFHLDIYKDSISGNNLTSKAEGRISTSGVSFTASVNWDTTGVEPGTYILDLYMEVHTLGEWHESPYEHKTKKITVLGSVEKELGWNEVLDGDTRYVYYLGEDGPVTGWQKIDGVWYFFGDDFYLYEGWLKDGGNWYLLVPSMVTGWANPQGQWYYFAKNGAMVANGWAKDGKYWCWMGKDGLAVTNKWQKIGGNWYYFDGNGHAVCNGWAKDGSYWCWMNADGVAITNKWQKADGHWYYFDGNGHAVCNGWVKDGAYWCWMDASGIAVTNAYADTDEGRIWFDADGHAVV